jgi:SAM-dependent methyltransferase
MRPAAAYPPFLDLVQARAGATLLDVSCGSGLLLKAAEARGVAAYGVDLSDAAVRLAHDVSPKAGVAVGTGEELCFRDASFDCVTCLGSLEHFLDVGRGLREMLRVAKPDARFCIMVPNRNFAGWRLLGRQGTAQQDINERLLSLAEWRQVFADEAFEVLQVAPDRWHAVKWRSRPGRGWLAAARGWLIEMAWRALPLDWEYQFIFVLRRAPPRSNPPTAPRSPAS